MPKKIKNLKLSFQKAIINKTINTGLIDSRLRSIAEITPRFLGKAKKPISAFLYDEHSHTVNYTAPIKREEIMDMVGFQKLLDACLKKDIMLTIKSIDFQTLRIKFDPTSRFSKSSFWNTGYKNLYPTIQPKLPVSSSKIQTT